MENHEKEILLRLYAYIKEMTHEQRIELLHYLEQKEIKDRRKYPRQPCQVSVSFSKDNDVDGVINNISVEGVFIETKKQFKLGERIRMSFALPGEQYPLTAVGDVVRIESDGFGIKFDTKDFETGFISSILFLKSEEEK